jgi:hypothetical protein
MAPFRGNILNRLQPVSTLSPLLIVGGLIKRGPLIKRGGPLIKRGGPLTKRGDAQTVQALLQMLFG